MSIRFKLLVFNMIGFGMLLILPIIFTYNIVNNLIIDKVSTLPFIGNIIGVLVIDVVLIVLMIFFFIAIDLSGDDRVSVLDWYDYAVSFRDTKIVNHSKLGKFLLRIDGNSSSSGSTSAKIYVYDVGILNIRLIDYFFLDDSSDIKNLTKFVNIILDNEYSKKLEEIKLRETEKKLKEDIDGIKKWDGYLDLEGKRDDKIDKLLGK